MSLEHQLEHGYCIVPIIKVTQQLEEGPPKDPLIQQDTLTRPEDRWVISINDWRQSMD